MSSVTEGDAGALEKLTIESAFRDAGIDPIQCVALVNIWFNVVFLGCKYSISDYEAVFRALDLIDDREVRLSARVRLRVALLRHAAEVDDGGILSNFLRSSA